MRLLFGADPLSPREPDPMYQAEVAAADALGIPYSLINFEALVDEQDARKAVRRVADSAAPDLGIYRGWMLRAAQYEQLFAALAERGINLVNDPAAYAFCHHLPNWYPTLERETPRSVWLTATADVSMDEVMELLRPFGTAPLIVKDFVKSRKHEWEEACFIPSAADRAAVERVVRRFLELQGEDLTGGLVFRRFEELEPLATHSRSGMPLTVEFRVFFFDAQPILTTEYWEEGEYRGQAPPLDHFTDLATAVRSRFFTMDLARRRAGDWIVVELGDGQVAGLPERADAHAFYHALRDQA